MKKACERLRTIRDRLGAPIDGASLAAFRILFGALLAFAMIRFLAKGWVGELYVRPSVFFPYEWFQWVKPLPLIAMHLLFVALAILGACVALGFHYRISLGLFLIGFTYVELIDKTTYLNHYYLISLLCGLMCFLPCHRMWSIDAWLRPSIRTDYAPRWTVDLLRFQFAAVYVFAGLAKLTPDWLLSAQPLRIWLAARNDLPAIGPLLDEGWVAYVASWSGAAYDLAIVPLLLHRKTRRIAFGLVVAFHLGTAILFRIGMFPWLMIIGTLLFFFSRLVSTMDENIVASTRDSVASCAADGSRDACVRLALCRRAARLASACFPPTGAQWLDVSWFQLVLAGDVGGKDRAG